MIDKPTDIPDKRFLPPDNYVKIWDKYSGHSLSEKNWLENAIKLDVYTSASPKLRALTNKLFNEISDKMKISKKSRAKQALKMVLINLWMGKQVDAPIRYSRNKNDYGNSRRYGKLYFQYNILLQIIDVLEELGYIHQKKGVFNSERNFGWQSKMWGTYKLWHQFTLFGLYTAGYIKTPQPEKLIILKDESISKPKEIKYPKTKKIRKLEENLENFNKFLEDHIIDVRLQRPTIIDNRFLLYYLLSNFLQNKVTIQSIILNHNITKYNKYPLLSSMTNTFSPKCLIGNGLQNCCGKGFFEFWFLPQLKLELEKCKSQKERDAFLSKEDVLENLGIEVLIFRLNYEYLHRVFNRKSFKKGGRAYGALHQNLPKHMRPNIHINGEKTTEIDYSAYHIRMLYHMDGIEYTDDPYLVCGGSDLRDTFKAAMNCRRD